MTLRIAARRPFGYVSAALLLFLAAGVVHCTAATQPAGCTKDADCASGRICNDDGRCAGAATPTPATTSTSGTWPTPSATSTSTSTAPAPPPPQPSKPGGCSADGDCAHRCVSGKCVDCKTTDDCRSMGTCHVSTTCSLIGDCWPKASQCVANACECDDISNGAGNQSCSCSWKGN